MLLHKILQKYRTTQTLSTMRECLVTVQREGAPRWNPRRTGPVNTRCTSGGDTANMLSFVWIASPSADHRTRHALLYDRANAGLKQIASLRKLQIFFRPISGFGQCLTDSYRNEDKRSMHIHRRGCGLHGPIYIGHAPFLTVTVPSLSSGRRPGFAAA